MSKTSVEERFHTTPLIEGRFSWVAHQLIFDPLNPLEANSTFTVVLEAGSETINGKRIWQEKNWDVTVREPEVVYLSPSEEPELWRTTSGGEPERITSSGGQIFDFSISRDGNRIVYSIPNDSGGQDLYQILRENLTENLLLGCQKEQCTDAVISPLERIIAYSRIALDNAGNLAPRIWILFEKDSTTVPLYEDQAIHGIDPSWSPDGRYLAFYDPKAKGIRIVDFRANRHLFFDSNEGRSGSWSPAGNQLLFTGAIQTVMQPFSNVYEADPDTGTIKRLFENNLSQLDYSQPVWTPDHQFITVGMRVVESSPNKQIYLIDPDGDIRYRITDDQGYIHASYHWNPTGTRLIFQRYQTGVQGARPEVLVWDITSQKIRLLASDAALPEWLP